MTVPGLSAGALSASADLPEVPAAGSVVLLLVVPGVISVLSVPTSLTQNYNTHTNTSKDPSVSLDDALSFFLKTISKHVMLPVLFPCF